MGKFTFNEQAATKVDEKGHGKVLDTGIYDVTINTVTEDIASTGTSGVAINFTVDGDKYPRTIYGIWTHKADGTPFWNYNMIQNLMGLIGAKDLTEYNKIIEVRDGKKTVKAYKELDDKKCKLAIQKVKDFYNGEPNDKNAIFAVFNMNGQSYAESVRGVPAVQIQTTMKRLVDKETENYKKYIANGEADAEEAFGESLL